MKQKLLSCILALALCLGMGTCALAAEAPELYATGKAGENTITIALRGGEPGCWFGAVWKDNELLCLFDGTADTNGNWTAQVDVGRTVRAEDQLTVGLSAQNGSGVRVSQNVALTATPVVPDPKPDKPSGGGGGGSSAGSSTGTNGGSGTVIQPTFGDVRKEDYFAAPVQWALTRNITSGVEQGRFGPELPCTRGQIITFLWRAAGSPAVSGEDLPFDDVTEDDYFAPAVRWAVAQGITGGTGPDTFSPEAVCTRAQAVTLLYRAANGAAVSSASFRDVAAEDYFAAPVAWALERGITSGVGGDCFGPDRPCTRGQIVTFLWKEFADA